MRRPALLLILALCASLLAVAPAGASSDVACANRDAREVLGPDGFDLELKSPAIFSPSLAATGELTGSPEQSFRSARFDMVADFAPAARGTLDIALDWDEPGDYDLFVIDDEGWTMASSAEFNEPLEPNGEALSVLLTHCEAFGIVITNFAGVPQEIDLSLTVEVRDLDGEVRCSEDDPAPGCADKEAGDLPEAVVDERTYLYLTSDGPGQLSMAHTQSDAVPFRASLTTERPTNGDFEFHASPPVGFRTADNPFQSHFTLWGDEVTEIRGDLSAQVWVSSATMPAGGELYVEVYGDGVLLAQEIVDGADLSEVPRRVVASATDLDVSVFDFTVTVSAEPVATSDGDLGEPGDFTFTTYWGGVGFPSRLVLP